MLTDEQKNKIQAEETFLLGKEEFLGDGIDDENE